MSTARPLTRPRESREARDDRILANAKSACRAEWGRVTPHRLGRKLGELGQQIRGPYIVGSHAHAIYLDGWRLGSELRKRTSAAPWVTFAREAGDRQQLPAERRYVLVQLAPRPEVGLPPAVAVGYLRFAAGDRGSPQFIIPGVGGTVLSWCDCLGDDFRPPLWRDRRPQTGNQPPENPTP